MSRARWIGPLLTVGLVVSALGLGEGALRARPPIRGELQAALRTFEPEPDHRQAIILGTCLSEQHILIPELERALPPGWQLSNLGAPSTTPVEWYLAYKNRLAEVDIDLLVLAYGRFDLTEPANPWEAETLDLATADDLGSLIERSCQTRECAIDLRLRHLSFLWRYRPVLGALLLQRAGLAPLPEGALARLRVVEGLAERSSEVWDPKAPSVQYLTALLELATSRGARVVLLPLPLRPDQPDLHQQRARAALQAGIDGLAQAHGALQLQPPPLPAEHYQDEVHLHTRGARAFTGWLAEALPPVLRALPPEG